VTPASSGACRSITPTLNSSYPSFRTLT
jgi:hypothetical protein